MGTHPTESQTNLLLSRKTLATTYIAVMSFIVSRKDESSTGMRSAVIVLSRAYRKTVESMLNVMRNHYRLVSTTCHDSEHSGSKGE